MRAVRILLPLLDRPFVKGYITLKVLLLLLRQQRRPTRLGRKFTPAHKVPV